VPKPWTQASAQEAPTVRIGGFIQSLYGYTNQTSQQSVVSAGAPNGTGLPTGVGGSTATIPASTTNIARAGKHDIASNAGIDVIVNGKLANGMTYGGVISLNSNGLEGRQVVGQPLLARQDGRAG